MNWIRFSTDRFFYLFASCALLASGMVGCAGSNSVATPDPATPTMAESKLVSAPAPESAKAGQAQPPAPPAEMESVELQPDSASQPKPDEFRGEQPPPSPYRVEMFQQPTMGESRPMPRGENASTSKEDVSLKGFVKVESLRAVMTIGGRQVSIAAGEMIGQLRVIEIAPPRVVVQQGKQRWTISLLQGALSDSTGSDAANR